MASTTINSIPSDVIEELLELIATEFKKYVKKDGDKQLSEEDFTAALKRKLESMTPDEYLTESDLEEAIAAIPKIKLLRVDTYEALMLGYQGEDPKYKDTSTIYLVGTTTSDTDAEEGVNVYEEYIYLGEDANEARPYEKLGDLKTEIDTSNFVTTDDIDEMTKEDLNELWSTAFSED